ncbi:vacuolar sorting protein (VPS9) domain containing protein, partial [Entamoeba invadens IP1]
MESKEVKVLDTEINNTIRQLLKENKIEETVTYVYTKLVQSTDHPLKHNINQTYSTFENNFKTTNPKHFDNQTLKQTIIDVVTLITAEILFTLSKYYKQIKKFRLQMLQPLSTIVLEKVFPSAFQFIATKTKDLDFRFQLQAKKYLSSDLRLVLKIKPAIFPMEYPSSEESFMKTIDSINSIEESETVDVMREKLVSSQTVLIDEVKMMHSGELPKAFDSDDLLGLFSFSILHSHVKYPFAISLMLELFLNEEDFLTQAGYALTTYSIAIQSIIKMTEDECLKKSEVLSLDPIVALSKPTQRKQTILMQSDFHQPLIAQTQKKMIIPPKGKFVIGIRKTMTPATKKFQNSVDSLQDSPIRQHNFRISLEDATDNVLSNPELSDGSSGSTLSPSPKLDKTSLKISQEFDEEQIPSQITQPELMPFEKQAETSDIKDDGGITNGLE